MRSPSKLVARLSCLSLLFYYYYQTLVSILSPISLMHALSHSLAHRAPPATRTRVRWQPYNTLPTTVTSRSPSTSYLHTPASSGSSSPLTSISSLSLCDPDRFRSSLASVPQIPRDNQVRDLQKNRYVIGLVDQAVKSLCEIWHPQDIPGVFMTSSRATVTVGVAANISTNHKLPHLHHRNTQLPSPVSPSMQPSPDYSQSLSSLPVPQSHISQSQQCIASAQASKTSLVPIKGFVHEVLRRSRTSGIVLQTALCYLEAIRSKVPELVKLEQASTGVMTEPEAGSRIMLAEPDTAGLNMEPWAEKSTRIDDDSMHTVQVDSGSSQDSPRQPKTPSPRLLPLPPLPSPLLCPRRAFLASLILASKFTQDKCYSNRAWAKLSGLPPREIGRCERALGDALEWRLWVGKVPSATAPTSPSPNTGRAVVRSRSDGDLLAGSKTSLSWRVKPPTLSDRLGCMQTNSGQRGLRRCATLPAADFAVPPSTFGNFSHATTSLPVAPLLCAETTCWDSLSMSAASSPTTSMAMPQSQYADNLPESPMATPTLTYSPSSTESSSGDRTIQMTSFIDELMPPCNGGSCLASFLDNVKVPFGSAPSICMTPYAPPDFNPASGVYVSSTMSAIPYASDPSALSLYSY
jgi:hypothetical protein